MQTRVCLVSVLSLGAALLMPASFAHTPICSCYDNGDDTVTCEGGFSDGGSAAGVAIRILDGRDRVLIDGAMADDGSFTFDRPGDEFHVIFDAGQSHIVTIFSDDIE